MKIRLTKLFTFEMAHALVGHDGLCRHVHGHSFKLEVTVRGPVFRQKGHPKDGMVMDFKDLKNTVEKAFVSRFDHALALPATAQSEAVAALESAFGRVEILPFQPTCENLIGLCVEAIRAKMPPGVELFSVKLAETATAFAEWFAEDEA